MSDDSLDHLLKIGTDGAAVEKIRGRKHKHPEGWTPGIVLGRNGGTIVTDPRSTQPENWNDILKELLPDGFNVDEYEIDGDTVEVRAWDSNIGEGNIERLYYFKARLRLRVDLSDPLANIEDIIAACKSVTPAKIKKSTDGTDRTFWGQITDLQAGQGDGDGVEGMTRRALDIASLFRDRLEALKLSGTPAGSIFIPITGDLVEGVIGFYEMQNFSVSLDRRQQVKLVRRLLTEILLEISQIGLPVHVAVVPGNHGENRQNGKAYTTLGDNDDVAVVEQIAEAFDIAGFKNVTFSFPGAERLSLTVEVQGWIVGLTHGHVARATGTAEAKILSWFKNMAASRDPIGDSDILFTGHYHSGKYSQLIGDTEWIQGGALCDASAWFSQTGGLVNDPLIMMGTITRDQKLESITPHRWARSRVATEIV